MWTYNYTDELYHHGVKGMKWGVRKARQKTSITRKEKRQAKEAERVKRIKKNVDRFGVGGQALASYSTYRSKKRIKSFAAHAINNMANTYISSTNGSYVSKVGADYIRKAAITGLTISNAYDKGKAVRDVVEARIYKYEKYGV